jgi:tetratricopeptide (TPR) repeat protein
MVMNIPTDAPRDRSIRWGRLVLIAAITLGVAGAAFALVLKWTVEDEAQSLAQQQKPPEFGIPTPPRFASLKELHAEGRPIGDEEVAFWSDVAIYKPGKNRPRAVVVVKRGKQPSKSEGRDVYQGLLAREVVREGLMISAREEFGALVRDVPLGDPDVPGKPDAILRIGSRFRTLYNPNPADPSVGRITIVLGTGPKRKVLLAREFPVGISLAPNFGALVGFVEVYSREEFRSVLQQLGLAKTAASSKTLPDGEALPTGVEDALAVPVLTEQFAAVRALHQAIREKGDSSPLLIALARGYANLGSLTEKRWTPDHLTFKARALLYAQRVAVREDGSPRTRRAAGYAEAISGLLGDAKRDFQAAEKDDGGKGIEPWHEPARAYARSDAGALGKLADSRPEDPWPRYFRFLTLARSSAFLGVDNFCRGEIIGAGRELLDKVPDCYRVHDGMAATEGVASMHKTTTEGMEMFPAAMSKRLAAIPGLPKPALKQISTDDYDEVELRRVLAEAGSNDPSDVSWGVLARQLAELRFLQVCQHLHFLVYALGTSPTEFARAAIPLITDHPKSDYVACMGGLIHGNKASLLLRKIDMGDIEWKAKGMIFGLRAFDPELSQRVNDLAFAHISTGTVPGQELLVDNLGAALFFNTAHVLLKFDPESPLGRGCLIEGNWEEARPNAERWATDHGGDTFVIAKLGFHALKEGQYEEAEALFEKAMAQSPDRWIFDGLAASYRQTDRIDRWTAAVDKFLQSEDQALDHAHVAGDLADYLMSKNEFEKARPYAEISAASWAGWAMPKAARCAEHLEDWKTAELWMARTSMRYAANWLDWCYWCERTGHGDAHAAAELIFDQLAAGRKFTSDPEKQAVCILLMLADREADARPLLERQFEKTHDTLDGAILAYLLDRVGDAKAVEATLKSIAEEPKPTGPLTAKVSGILASWLASDQSQPPDFQAIDALLNKMGDLQANGRAFVGLILVHSSAREKAIEYLKEANVESCTPWIRLIAMHALRSQGIDAGIIPW